MGRAFLWEGGVHAFCLKFDHDPCRRFRHSTCATSPEVHAATLTVLAAAPWKGSIVRNADYWRRYYRRHGDTWQRYLRPEPQPDAPVRPLNCGEFRFWDGERCVDVRFR